MTETLWKDVDIRVIDQRIGAGVGGMDTVIRVLHRPTGIIIEMPGLTSAQFKDRQIALEMLEYGLAAADWKPTPTPETPHD